MNTSHARHPGRVVVSLAARALFALLIVTVGFGVAIPASAADWPDCGSSGCVSGDLVVEQVFINAQPCVGATRAGILRATLRSVAQTRYNVRVTAEVYVVDGSGAAYLETVNTCWEGAFSGTQTMVLDSNISWDCNASLELRSTLVSWQVQSDSFTCLETLPCDQITPKCNDDYYDQQISVVGSESPNAPPAAVADAATTYEEQAVEIDVLANDSDPDGDPVSFVSVSDPARGTAEIIGSIIRYTPDPFFFDFDSFTYVIEDSHGAEASASVSVHVVHPNTPPIANAGGSYEGDTRTLVVFDGRFSIDPDVSDILEYRWDVDGDGTWDTDWSRSPGHSHLYDRPFIGTAILEVRDIYRGSPLETSDQDDAYVRIRPAPTQIAVSVYVDLNGNGEFDDEDVGLPGVLLLLDEDAELMTGDDGTAVSDDVGPGFHTVRISDDGVIYLRARGFFLDEETLTSVEVESGDWVALFFAPQARGFLQVDLGAEDGESPEADDTRDDVD